ncbi:MAG: hypothetical protein KJ556_14225 [Gammaproteobacteria bacterium]|nr:hypothetical protein [Gammaproteobacteria bacterium]MBU2057514.1 hypothetical protein [Gammaproteobacteria bacterium]MBU2176274.1 hypothetical protein [Gammaproteobacteria bacterium]MBU2245875.1 hypothetical protein [Gammaproteobacteria bacterium]MBU2344147.1 hypothetical protein [Gammaproteobacteria bacterium]
MSEYQYFQFELLEGSLDKAQQAELRGISSRATINRNHFSVSYHYSDLKAEPVELVAEFFDVGFYYASWGSLYFYLKVPQASVPEALLAHAGIVFGFESDLYGSQLVLTFSVEEDERYFDDETAADLLRRLSGIRDELLAGDFRALYLPWVSHALGKEEDERFPIIPLIHYDFSQLTDAQQALAEFLQVSEEEVRTLQLLLQQVPGHPAAHHQLTPEQQVEQFTAEQKDQLLLLLFQQGSMTTNQALQYIPQPTQSQHNFSIWLGAQQYCEFFEQAQQQVKLEQEQAKQQAQQQALRERRAYLETVYMRRSMYWQNIKAEVGRASANSYNKAAADLYELCEAYEMSGALAEFVLLYMPFFQQIQSKRALVKRLERLNNYMSTL